VALGEEQQQAELRDVLRGRGGDAAIAAWKSATTDDGLREWACSSTTSNSIAAVPEPSALVLVLAGGVLHRFFRRARESA
jgi:hypothetical protein